MFGTKGWSRPSDPANLGAVAGNVVLDLEEVRSILSLYHLEDLEEFGGHPESSFQASYWVKAGGRRYDLRITERKTLDDMVYERDLLQQLARAGLPVPALVRNVARGTFTPWERRGRYISLFEHMPGRALGVFEVRARHVRAVGRLLGELHRASSALRRRRQNPTGFPLVQDRMRRLERALERRRLARRFEPVVSCLAEELDRQERRIGRSALPTGAIHGGLGINRVRFRKDQLVGVVRFEGACRDRILLDLATALVEWCWEPSPKQRGGPAGRFRVTKVRAFLDGYQGPRRLTAMERRHLPDEVRYAALRTAILDLYTHELSRAARAAGAPYRDFRHATARLEALAAGRAEELVARALKEQ